MLFDLTSVTVQYESIPALHNCSCLIPSGSSLLLTGPTGAGKTTLLKLLYADLMPTSGDVFVNGQRTSSFGAKRLRQVRQTMGIIFQDAKLVRSLTVFENVMYPLVIKGTTMREANKKCLEVLADIGISYIRDKYPHELSGGEKHLTGLARAIIHQPTCIIADEPTGNVDSETADTIATILRKENERGATLIVATHDPYLAVHFANTPRMALYEGEIAAMFHPEEITPLIV